MTGPLDGLQVIDCSTNDAGLRATGMLADYGADVIWVEPTGGSPFRAQTPAAASVFNRGKRSVILDVAGASDHRQLTDLIHGADVFMHTFTPAVARGFALDFASLHADHPATVCCTIAGFEHSPGDVEPEHETLVHAWLGTMAEQPGHRSGPIFPGLPFAGIGASYLAVIGTLAALYRRATDGHGRHVETSLVDGALAYLSMLWGDSDTSAGGMPVPAEHRIVARTFCCGDGRYLGVHTGAVGAFDRLMRVLALDDRIRPRTGLDLGVALTAEEQRILAVEPDRIFATRSLGEWLDRLIASDVCAIEHLPPGEVYDEPQTKANDMVLRMDDPILGIVDQVAPAARLHGTSPHVPAPAPRPGAHDDEILRRAGRRATPSAWAIASVAPDATPDDRPLLDGVHMLDAGAFYAGPYASRLLADLGADVIKVEPPHGDPLRGMQQPFLSAQKGKRSLCADLKDDELGPARDALIRWADVILHNMRPGAAERLGIDFDRVQQINPGVVYLAAPGWGSNGPRAHHQSFAPLLSGYVGIGFECAGRDNPPVLSVGNEDSGNGLLGATVVLMALLHRQRTGRGQLIEAPQLNATMAHLAHAVRTADGTTLGTGTLDAMQFGHGPFDRIYPTRDGWLCVVATSPGEQDALLRTMGAPTAAVDLGRCEAYLEAAIRCRATAELLRSLNAADVPALVPSGPNMSTFLADRRQRSVGRTVESERSTGGHVREIGTLVRITGTRMPDPRLAPGLGEHTDDVLLALGYTLRQITALRRRGAVH